MPTNHSFAAQTIVLNEVGAELNNRQNYLWQCLLFALGAMITSIVAVLKAMKKTA